MWNMCVLCRILHDPIWFRYLLLVGNIHQFWVAALVRESTYTWLWRLDFIEILSRFPYVHTDSYIVSMILQSVRWWIFLWKGNKGCSIDTLLSYGLLLVHTLVAYPSCATRGKHFEWCGTGQTLTSLLMARVMYRTYARLLEAWVTR